MNDIIYHKNHSSNTTYPTNLTQGCINPLRRTSYKSLINLSSRFRSNYSSTVSTDFFVDLAEPLKNVVSMNINSINIPPSIYLINEKIGSNNFIIKFLFLNSSIVSGMSKVEMSNKEVLYELPDEYNLLIKVNGGTYTGEDLAKEINNKIYENNNFINNYSSTDSTMTQPVLGDNLFDISYDSFNDKFIFDISSEIWFKRNSTFYDISGIKIDFTYQNPIDISGTSIPDDSILQPISKEEYCKNYGIYNEISSNIDKNQLTLGWILGFRGQYLYNTPLDASFSSLNCNSKKQFPDCSTRSLTRNELKQLINNKSTNRNYIKTGKNGLKYLNELIPEEKLETVKPISAFYITKNKKNLNKGFKIISTSLFSLVSNNYLLLSVNDFQNNHNSSLVSLYEESSLQDNNLIAKISDPSAPFLSSSCCFKETNCNFSCVDRIYFGPTKINRLQIKLLDMFGRIADLNNGDWSLVLEVELLYDL